MVTHYAGCLIVANGLECKSRLRKIMVKETPGQIWRRAMGGCRLIGLWTQYVARKGVQVRSPVP